MLSKEEIIRYQRQIMINGIGIKGQEMLNKSRVLVVGAGGLGSAVLYYLAAAGVGCLGIIDHDKVELSNLNRQILHFTKDIGSMKAVSASDKLMQINPGLHIDKYTNKLTRSNIDQVIKHYDLVVDCVDNIQTRQVVNKACQKNKKNLIEAGVTGFSGFVMTIIPGNGACYQCLYPMTNDKSSKAPGVLGAIAGVTGSLQAIEAIKILLNKKQSLKTTLFSFNTLDMNFMPVKIEKNPQCPVCGKNC